MYVCSFSPTFSGITVLPEADCCSIQPNLAFNFPPSQWPGPWHGILIHGAFSERMIIGKGAIAPPSSPTNLHPYSIPGDYTCSGKATCQMLMWVIANVTITTIATSFGGQLDALGTDLETARQRWP